MANSYGAEISQQGVPVSQASDDQKIIDTRWITLDISNIFLFSNTLTYTPKSDFVTVAFKVCAHNLGYLPAFDYAVNSITYSDPSAGVIDIEVYADETNVYYATQLFTLQASLTITIDITVQVYTLNITQPYTAPTVQSISSVNPSNTGYGIEFVSEANASPDINEDTVNEFTFSTRLKPLNILQNGPITASGGNIVISYSYPTYPLYQLCQYYPNGNSTYSLSQALIGSLGFQGARGSINSTTLTISGEQAGLTGSFAYILLKDPIGLTK